MKKKANLYRFVRNPRLRYIFEKATTPNYVYCTTQAMHIVSNKRGPCIYNVNNIPPWVWLGMDMIDLAVDPVTKTAHIPGFGGKLKEKYFFYEEGVVNEPHNLS
jgi:hypothetical protein